MTEASTTLFSFYLSIGNIILSICLFVALFFLQKKFKGLMIGDAKNIPDSLAESKKQIGDLQKFQKEVSTFLETLQKKVARSIQSTELVRFTPFSGIGSNGNQSFSLAFLNEQGDGIVVSGLYYSRDRVSIFTKPIKGFISDFELTPEEKEVVSRSKQGLHTK